MSAFMSIVLRLPSVKDVWPDNHLGWPLAGPIIEADNLPRFERIVVRIEWIEYGPLSPEEVALFVIGLCPLGDQHPAVLLHQERTRPGRGDWPDIANTLAEKFRADFIEGSEDSMYALELLGIGMTRRMWAIRQQERRIRQHDRERGMDRP